jgi:hypothetical protein
MDEMALPKRNRRKAGPSAPPGILLNRVKGFLHSPTLVGFEFARRVVVQSIERLRVGGIPASAFVVLPSGVYDVTFPGAAFTASNFEVSFEGAIVSEDGSPLSPDTLFLEE